jgi:glutathione synthase/RimK-type ligase-like ATP-grasp enzyme
MHAPDAFLRWVQSVGDSGIPVWNPHALVAWNIDKTYLLELEHNGIPIVPTVLARSAEDVVTIAHERAWEEVMVKPRIGANGNGVLRVDVRAAFVPPFQGQMLVQPYCASIETEGECSLVYIGGSFSHAVRKYPKEGSYHANRSRGATVAPADAPQLLLDIATQTLAYCAPGALYARVDLLFTDKDHAAVSEVELIETGLFTDMSQDVPRLFGQALAERLATRRR